MKYFILFLLLITPFAFAQDLILAKHEYLPKQTFQAEVFAKDIKQYDISILNSLGYRTNIGANLIELTRDHYFIYFNIPELEPGNYTLKVKELKKPFKIKPKIQEIISISPPAIKFTPEKSSLSKIAVSNNNIKSETIKISSSSFIITSSVNSLIIPPKSSKSFYITLKKPSTNQLAVISIQDYNIPVWFITDDEIIPFLEEEIAEMPEVKQGLEFFTESKTRLNFITKEIQESIPIVDSIYFKNTLNETLNNLKISLTGNLQDIVKLEFLEINNLVPNEEKKLGITVNEERTLLEDSYSGSLLLTTDKSTFKLPINFIVVEKPTQESVTESLTLEEITEPLEEPEEKITIEDKTRLEGKWIYLLVLIIILIAFAYLSLRKPKQKKQTFRQYVKKIKH